MVKCETCKANVVCDHNKFGFENCNNYIPRDVVNVVRCKDCKHFRPYYHGDFGECRKLGESPDLIEMYEYNFCSYGERWNEGGD